MNKKKSITRTYSVLTYIKFMMYYELLHIQFSIRTVATGAQNVLSNKIKKKKLNKNNKRKDEQRCIDSEMYKL